MRIGIVGCAGRMGRMLIHEVVTNDASSLAGGTEIPGSPLVGKDLATLGGLEPVGIAVIDDPAALFDAADAVIDFTSPLVIEKNAALAAEKGVALVVGTTGLARVHEDALRRAGEKTRIVFAANMSAGVNLLLGLTQQVSAILGEDYDIEIVEMHHHHKVDAPSGTALALGEAAAAGRKVDLETVSQRVRDGHTGARRAGDIGFATLRGGDVTGEHTVVFAGPGERIELTHKASSRTIWARGAVRAALWAQDRAPGLYSMRDVLGFD